MDHSAVIALVEEILEVETGTVSAADSLTELDWDSLSNLSFIAEIDARLGVSIDASDLSAATTVSDIIGLVDHATDRA